MYCYPRRPLKAPKSLIHRPVTGVTIALKLLQPSLDSHGHALISHELKMQSKAKWNTGVK